MVWEWKYLDFILMSIRTINFGFEIYKKIFFQELFIVLEYIKEKK